MGCALIAVFAVGASGCVDTFDGVDIQATFDPGVLGAAESAGAAQPGQPPPDTHLTLYAIDLVYQRDGDGEVVVDEEGEPVVERSFAYGLVDFEIKSVIDLDDPCFIELDSLEAGIVPGLHVTRLADKLRDRSGIDDPLDPPDGADEGDIIDILTADQRMSFLGAIQSDLRAVVAPSTARAPEADTGCAGDGDTSPDLVPPPGCIDDASNERRLALCQEFWADNPDYYAGSDRAYADPLNGTFYGLVDGTNPKNQSQLGGVEFLLDVDWTDFEAIAINWQYDDRDGDGEPDYPDDLPAEERSVLGYHYLQGPGSVVKRGVISYSLRNRTIPSISGEISVLNGLGEDDVHF